MEWPGGLVKEHARQSQPLSWENCNDTSKYTRHKREAGVFSSVTYTRKSAASNQPCLTSLSRLENLKPSPAYTALLISPSTPIPSALSSLHLDHLSFLSRRVWLTQDTVSGNNRLAENKYYSFTGSLTCSFPLYLLDISRVWTRILLNLFSIKERIQAICRC